ncbi:MAG: hypothetical protein BMS9Abin08_0978 [Gammaproteobacteria bacterium]|nr:MAG: hypothetical protein BMS9Abin06_0593 [Gammaproteobacteria bacterium]GMQ87770.1 MAG: hypothetical protein BMS9Abin08_0978 [Gammaproteobacteria bacterium]
MNVDAQFPQAPITALPNRPPQAQADQAAERPVDKADKDEPSNNRTGTDARETEAQKTARQPENETRGARQESELNAEEKKQVEQLKTRDREVRAHEAAHKAAAGSLARGGASFEFEDGPDGRRYAVGGEVNIDTSKVSDDPQATISKAQTIRAAANAPAQPSGQDRSVASKATQMEAEARQEVAEEQRSETNGTNKASGRAPDSNLQTSQEVAEEQRPDTSGTNNASSRTPASNFQANSADPEPVGDLLDVLA